MEILRTTALWVCRIVFSLCLGAWILVACMQATVLDRQTAKHWLADSHVFDNGFILQVETAEASAGASLVTPEMAKTALNQTFDGAYVKTSANVMIDATYDWLEGKADAIRFSIPVQEKADEFAKNMQALIEPELAALPACTSRLSNADSDQITCLPRGVTAADFAAQITRLSKDSDFLKAPLTQDTVKDISEANFSDLDELPAGVQSAHILFWSLPVVLLLLAGAFVLISRDRLTGLKEMGKQLVFSTVIPLLTGLVLWLGTSALDLSNLVDNTNPAEMATAASILNGLAHIILPDIGQTMSLFAGLVMALGVTIWVGVAFWRKKQPKTLQHAPHGYKSPAAVAAADATDEDKQESGESPKTPTPSAH